MEVHRPHSPFHSWRDFLVEIATIVIGVLIALSFDGAREAYHNRALARDAREAIAREIADNRKSVDSDLENADTRKQNLEEALRFADEILAKGKTSLTSMNLAVSLGDLSTASWQTAERTGALAQMSYAEVQQYASAYTLQDQYQAQERRTFEHLASALSLVPTVVAPTPPRADVEQFRSQVLTLNGDLYVERQLARQLRDRYVQLLKN